MLCDIFFEAAQVVGVLPYLPGMYDRPGNLLGLEVRQSPKSVIGLDEDMLFTRPVLRLVVSKRNVYPGYAGESRGVI